MNLETLQSVLIFWSLIAPSPCLMVAVSCIVSFAKQRNQRDLHECKIKVKEVGSRKLP